MPNVASLPDSVPASAPPTSQCSSSALFSRLHFFFSSVPAPFFNMGSQGEGGAVETSRQTGVSAPRTLVCCLPTSVGRMDMSALCQINPKYSAHSFTLMVGFFFLVPSMGLRNSTSHPSPTFVWSTGEILSRVHHCKVCVCVRVCVMNLLFHIGPSLVLGVDIRRALLCTGDLVVLC